MDQKEPFFLSLRKERRLTNGENTIGDRGRQGRGGPEVREKAHTGLRHNI